MTTKEKSHKRRLWHIARGALSIFLPIQETQWYLRTSKDITARNLDRIRNAFPEPEDTPLDATVSPSWIEAVSASGLTPEELEKGYCRQRRRWRVMFWLVFILLPPLTLFSLSNVTDITVHQISTTLVLFSGAGVAWSKALIVTFRLWQLRNRRVSLEECGTFRHFIAGTNAVRNAIWGD
ncbi:conjugal transfer protein TraX [Pectobacterium atrosepticum]|uniref:conjugal transfer protein TraX n=1 Tax=Pectobacterium atrosepticum TaxID=29471 RepID=UPI003015C63E